jgi:glyoxylase-like metal-dependent hydrolase (beta-lactamase superfamily II)
MEVIRQAFPDVKIVAHPVVVADIWRSLPYKVKRWSAILGANGPLMPTAPAPLEGDTIMLEGQPLKVLGPMQGDHVHATVLWAPSIRALFAGDLLFNEMHLWFAEHDPAAVQGWAKSVAMLADLKPEIVVPGHSKPGLPNDASALDFTRRYLEAWPKLVAQSKDSAELRARAARAFPDAIDTLGDFLLGNSSRVAKGEEPIWTE